MKKILFPILALILSACGTATATQTSEVFKTSEVSTLTQTFTPPPTLTLSPTITFTPTPSLPSAIILDVESRLAGYTLAGERLRDRAGNLVADVRVEPSADGETWTLVRAPYEFTFEGETFSLPYPTRYKAADLTLTPEGDLALSGHLWQEGDWQRKKVLDPEGKETEFPKYSTDEAEVMMVAATVKTGELDPNRETIANVRKLIGFADNNRYIIYEGVKYTFKTGKGIGNSKIYFIDQDGKPIKETRDIAKIPVILYGYFEVDPDGQSYLVFEENGKKIEVFIDGKLGDISYYGKHDGVGPFALTEEQYQAILASLTSTD